MYQLTQTVPTFFEGNLLFSTARIFQYSALHFAKRSPPEQIQEHGLIFK